MAWNPQLVSGNCVFSNWGSEHLAGSDIIAGPLDFVEMVRKIAYCV